LADAATAATTPAATMVFRFFTESSSAGSEQRREGSGSV